MAGGSSISTIAAATKLPSRSRLPNSPPIFRIGGEFFFGKLRTREPLIAARASRGVKFRSTNDFAPGGPIGRACYRAPVFEAWSRPSRSLFSSQPEKSASSIQLHTIKRLSLENSVED
jgi:hypothetical protein